MDLKKPLTFSEQVDKLKQHNLIINDEKFALKVLSEINYYRFTGYLLQFRKAPDDSDLITSTNFSEIYSIYKFDEALRDVLRLYIERVEVFCRTQISYFFSLAKCTNSPYDQHYDRNNFYSKSVFDKVVINFANQKIYYSDSLIIQHHQKNYGNKMPLWVIVEFLSLSKLSQLYNSMYISDKETIAKSMGTGYKTLENHLHCLSLLRNKCAHAARLYNTKLNPPARFSTSFLRNNPNFKNDMLFAYILVLMKRLPELDDKKELNSKLLSIINNYAKYINLSLIGFPNNYIDLLNKEIK